MRHCLIFIMGLFLGGVISSAWWAASRWGWIEYGKTYDALWSIPGILTILTVIFIGLWIKDSFEEED